MNHRRGFEIAFVGLKPGTHNFEYHIDPKFFSHYGEQDFSNCHAVVRLSLEKNNSFMLLKFDVDGKVDVICDRCGNNLTLQLWDEFKLTVKMVDDPEIMNEQEEDPDVYYISRGESHLHVADWIYEFINLSLPMQKMCPIEEIGGTQCNQEALNKLRQMEEEANKAKTSMWKGLEQFRNLDN